MEQALHRQTKPVDNTADGPSHKAEKKRRNSTVEKNKRKRQTVEENRG
jgi:hypothetical protein